LQHLCEAEEWIEEWQELQDSSVLPLLTAMLLRLQQLVGAGGSAAVRAAGIGKRPRSFSQSDTAAMRVHACLQMRMQVRGWFIGRHF